MISLIQRVKEASVRVEEQCIASIEQGILALIGFEKQDTLDKAIQLIQKIIQYRIFEDKAGKTNLSLTAIEGALLLVPQFTLVADTQKGLRPSFSKGMPPIEGRTLFEAMVSASQSIYPATKSGQFGANMQVHLINDGPMTFILTV